MAIDIDQLHKRANEIYAERKPGPWNSFGTKPENIGFVPPECLPKIQSNQVLAVMEALQEQLTAEFDRVREEIADVYRHLDSR